MLAQKYRPHRFTDVVGQDLIKNNLMNQSKRNIWSQVYILGGQFGSGKTTLARIIAMAVNCQHRDENGNPCGKCPSCRAILEGDCSDILEIDAASNTGVDNVRKLIELSEYAPMVTKKRVFIIDEVHRLSTAAFESLLKLLEEPPVHCIFVLATTDVEKIPKTVQSRACKYTFGRIPENLISEHIAKVAMVENINITKGACDVIARASDGAMRNAMMTLERVSYSQADIDEEAVIDIIGATDESSVLRLLNCILGYDLAGLAGKVHEFASVGKNFYTLSGEMLNVCTDLILRKCGGTVVASDNYLKGLDETKGELKQYARLSGYLIDLREKVRSDASESAFLALSFKALNLLKDEFSPERIEYVVKNEARETKETAVPFTEDDMVSVPAEESMAASMDVSDMLEDDEGFETCFSDPFDALNSIPAGSTAHCAEPVMRKACEEEADAVQVEDAPAPVIEEEEIDDGVNYPKAVKSLKGLEGAARTGAISLRNALKQDSLFLSLINDSFRVETYTEGVILETDDKMAFRQAAMFAHEHELECVEFVQA